MLEVDLKLKFQGDIDSIHPTKWIIPLGLWAHEHYGLLDES